MDAAHTLVEPQEKPRLDIEFQAFWDSFLREHLENDIITAAHNYPETRSIEVSWRKVQERDSAIGEALLENPTKILRIATMCVNSITTALELIVKPELEVHVVDLPPDVKLRPHQVRRQHLNRLVAVEGRVKKVTEVRPMIYEAVFQCKFCTNEINVVQLEDLLEPPIGACDACEKTGAWHLLTKESIFKDHQKIELQEFSEHAAHNGQPERMVVYLSEDLVQKVAPGDVVTINGILQVEARRQGTRKRTEFAKVLHGRSIEIDAKQFSEIELTDADVKEIKEFAAQGNVLERLRNSFAPTIWGMDTEKDALLFSLFGGVRKVHHDGTSTRGDIHVLLIGDPGVAKSQLLRHIARMSPRSVTASGKSASAAGLTAAAMRDEFGDGGFVAEAGAMVLADMGIACIDELDKMSKNDQSALHEAMEQQEISLAKAGLNVTLRCQCAVIGAANPKMGRFDDYAPIHEQINMPPALLSRFDLIFSLRDKPSRDRDAALADHLLSSHHAAQVNMHAQKVPGTNIKPIKGADPEGLTPDFICKYVAYSKRHIFPIISDDARAIIKAYYVDNRNTGDGSFPFTARQLEAVQRIAEASARMRISQVIEAEDAEAAVKIAQAYLNSVGRDPSTGKLDFDILATGIPRSQHDRMRSIQDVVIELADQSDKGCAEEDDIVDECLKKYKMGKEAVLKGLEGLRRNNTLYNKCGHATYAVM